MAGSPKSKSSNRSLKITAVAVISCAFLALSSQALAESPQGSQSRALVNQTRSENGLGSLEVHPGLEAIAQQQADRMAARDAIYHNPNLKSDADANGVKWTWIGENVGVGPDVNKVHQGFLASPGHRENIVYPDYNTIGVGTAIAKDGSIFVAHAYARVEKASPAPQVSAPAPAADPQVAPKVVQTENKVAPAATNRPETVEPAPAEVIAVIGGVVNTEIVF